MLSRADGSAYSLTTAAYPPEELTAQFQALYDVLVAGLIRSCQIIKKFPAGADHLNEAITGVMVVFVGFKVVSQPVNAMREQSHLYAGRPAVLVMTLKGLLYFGLCFVFHLFLFYLLLERIITEAVFL